MQVNPAGACGRGTELPSKPRWLCGTRSPAWPHGPSPRLGSHILTSAVSKLKGKDRLHQSPPAMGHHQASSWDLSPLSHVSAPSTETMLASPGAPSPHRPQPPSCPFGDSTNLQSDCPLLHAPPRPGHVVFIVNRNKPTPAQPTCPVRVLVGHKGLGTHACVQCQPWGQCTLTRGCPCSRCPRASPLPCTHQTCGKVPRRGNAGSARDPRPRHGSPGCRAPVK